MKAIYSRISTANQNHDRQLQDRKEYDFIYLDVISGGVPFAQRPEAQKLLSNDKVTFILVKEVSRLGRNSADVLKTIEYFKEKKVNIHIENLGLFTILPDGRYNRNAKLVIDILAALSEQERAILHERTQEGREIAKAQGKFKGRKRGANADREEYKAKHVSDIRKVDELIKKNSISSISRTTGIPRTRIYRFIDKGLVTLPKETPQQAGKRRREHLKKLLVPYKEIKNLKK